MAREIRPVTRWLVLALALVGVDQARAGGADPPTGLADHPGPRPADISLRALLPTLLPMTSSRS